MRISLKNIGLLEVIVVLSGVFVVGMLLWTVSTRPAVEAKANQATENHKKVVELINNEVNRCGSVDDGTQTLWGDPCNEEWKANKILNYISNNLDIKNPYSEKVNIKTDPDPRLKAEGKAGQTVEMGVIFLMSKNFSSEPGSEWIVGTCIKSPCVAAGNNELTSIYR